MRYMLAFLLMFGCHPAPAGENNLEDYIDWISEHTPYEYNGEELPDIRYKTQSELDILFYGPEGDIEYPVVATYDTRYNTMYLRDTFNWSRDGYVVLHELVHYMQLINDVRAPVACVELEAYTLHIKYLDDFDLEGIRANPVFLLELRQACMSGIRGSE